jgi:hypothetical protein
VDTPTDLDAATFLVALLALLVSAGAIFYTHRATKAAERSAKAAELSADAAARTAAVDERQEQRALADAEARAVRWRVTPMSTAAVHLTNDGDETAYDVHVTVPPISGVLGRPLPAGESVPSGTALLISASVRFGGDLEVTWRRRPDGPQQSWRHPIG